MLDRRQILAGAVGGAAALGLSSFVPPAAPGAMLQSLADLGPMGLAERANRKGLTFGSMVNAAQVGKPSPFTPALLREVSMIVPEVEMKWGALEMRRGHPDYGPANVIADFAKAHQLALRGHAAFWWMNIPSWVVSLLPSPQGEALALRHVSDVVKYFKGRVFEWDVINEVVDPQDGAPGCMRAKPFGRPTSVSFLVDCFHAARDADPDAKLYYNDYGVETEWPDGIARRGAILALLEEFKKRGAPIDGFGTQSHLATHRPFNPFKYRAFLKDVAALGLEIRITEFDVADYATPGDAQMLDLARADCAKRYLDCCFDEPAVKGMLTWGLSNRDSWLRKINFGRRPDGQPEYPLPLDDHLGRNRMWGAIAQAIDGAPKRGSV